MQNPRWPFLLLLIGCGGGSASHANGDRDPASDAPSSSAEGGATQSQTDGGPGPPADDASSGNGDGSLALPDGTSPRSEDGAHAADGGVHGRTSIGWAVDYPDDVFTVIAAHTTSFTHVAAFVYEVESYSGGGVAPFWNTPGGADVFQNGLTSTTMASTVHAMGLKYLAAVAGGAELNSNQGILNILTDSPTGTQSGFIASMVSEAVTKGYDGYALDWEMGGAPAGQIIDASNGAQMVAFLDAFKAALHAHGMILTVAFVPNDVMQSCTSYGNGVWDLTTLGEHVDLAMLEDYATTLGPATTSCPASFNDPPGCYPGTVFGPFSDEVDLLCVSMLRSRLNITMNAWSQMTNPFAGDAMSLLESYHVRSVGLFPQNQHRRSRWQLRHLRGERDGALGHDVVRVAGAVPRALTPARLSSPGVSVACDAGRQPREVDAEDATDPREVSHPKSAAVGLDALATEREPEAQPAAVGAPLVKRQKELVGLARGQPAALVLHLDRDAEVVRRRPQLDATAGPRELEGVLQEIGDGRGDELTVDLDLDARVPRRHHQGEPEGARLHRSHDGELFEEVAHRGSLGALGAGAGLEAHLGEGAVDQAQSGAGCGSGPRRCSRRARPGRSGAPRTRRRPRRGRCGARARARRGARGPRPQSSARAGACTR